MANNGRKMYRSANGKLVDFDVLRQKNELTPAVGNMRVNARGDKIGPNGEILKSRDEILKDFYSQADIESSQASKED